jgi:hypothetical protein
MNALAGLIAKQIVAIILPIIVAAVTDEIRKHIPTIIHATVAAVTETLTTATVRGVDQITNIIPGQLDDRFIDPIVASVLQKIQDLL